MHFSKTYTQLLLTLPEELRNSAIEYRRLKKLINKLVAELSSLGLDPEVLQDLLQNEATASTSDTNKGKQRALGERPSEYSKVAVLPLARDLIPSSAAKAAYELSDVDEQGEIVPRLRLWIEQTSVHDKIHGSEITDEAEISDNVDQSSSLRPRTVAHRWALLKTKGSFNGSMDEGNSASSEKIIAHSSPITHSRDNLLWDLRGLPVSKPSISWIFKDELDGTADDTSVVSCFETSGETSREVVIPLVSDTEFYRLLTNALNSLASALENTQKDMMDSINDLCEVISQTARPASVGRESDLYTWRSVFQFYIEAEVFESTQERNRGERTIEDSEARLARFAHRVGNGGFAFKLNASQEGLQRLLEFNVRLMNIKKFQNANAEAARKIMKKHVKRTALPVPNYTTDIIPSLNQNHASIPHILIVALTERLLPILPHIDDYLCLICTSLAYKPIRLNCGHLFCVRCLVKMQKRVQNNCPMCRAPNVLSANKSNLDCAVINLMRDWFPKEMKAKALANEKEVAQEQLDELGLDNRCLIM